MKAARKILAIVLALMLALSSMAVFAESEEPTVETEPVVAAATESEEPGQEPAPVKAPDLMVVDEPMPASTAGQETVIPTTSTSPEVTEKAPIKPCPAMPKTHAAAETPMDDTQMNNINNGIAQGYFVDLTWDLHPDCTQSEYLTYTCNQCGGTFKQLLRKGEAAHKYDEPGEEHHQTVCDIPGTKEMKCSNAPVRYVESADKKSIEKLATTNTKCGAVKEEVIPGEEKKEHKPIGDPTLYWVADKDSTQATCKTEGHIVGNFMCDRQLAGGKCTHVVEKVDKTAKLEHTWIVKDPNLLQSDLDRLNKYFKVTKVIGENHDAEVVITGLTSNTVTEGAGFGTVKGTVKGGKSCEDPTEYVLTCQLCGATHTETVPGKSHVWVSLGYHDEEYFVGTTLENLSLYEGGKEPTCLQDGSRLEICLTWFQAHKADFDSSKADAKTLADIPESERRSVVIPHYDHDFGNLWGLDADSQETPEGWSLIYAILCTNNYKGSQVYSDFTAEGNDTNAVKAIDAAIKSFKVRTANGNEITDLSKIKTIVGEYREGILCVTCTLTVPCFHFDWTTGQNCTGTDTFVMRASTRGEHNYAWSYTAPNGETLAGGKRIRVPIVVEREPECGKPGLGLFRCDICNKVTEMEFSLPTTEHKWEQKVTKAPTCTATGLRTLYCTNPGCDATIENEEMPMVAHSYAKTDKYVDADCKLKKNGFDSKKCTVCGNLVEKEIPWESAHVIDNQGSDYKEEQPTCTKDGKITYTCKLCKTAGLTKTIPALGHDYVKNTANKNNYKVVQEGNCETDELSVWVCQRCKAADTETFVSVKHPGHKLPRTAQGELDMDHIIETKPATCTEDGLYTYSCQNQITKNGKKVTCNAKCTEVIPAAHDYQLIIPSDEKHPAYMKCTICGATKALTDVTAALELDLDGVVVNSNGTSGKGTFTVENLDVLENSGNTDWYSTVPNIDTLWARVTWSYTTASGEAFTMCDVREMRPDYDRAYLATFRMQGPGAPAGSTLRYVHVIITDDEDSAEKQLASVKQYVSKTMQP